MYTEGDTHFILPFNITNVFGNILGKLGIKANSNYVSVIKIKRRTLKTAAKINCSISV